MKETIRKFVENGQDTGLMLLDMPTGSGKTYSVLDYITEESLKPENRNRKYIFITTLKKNLPGNLLRNMFLKRNAAEKFEQKFLFIDSNVDAVIENFDKARLSIPIEITEMEEYKVLKKNVDIILDSQKDNKYGNPDLRPIIDNVKEEIRLKYEPDFRHAIERILQKEYYLVSERLKVVRDPWNEWHWVSILYPAALTKEKQIIFLTADKFLSRNSTVVEPSYLFTSSSLIKDSVIFIDEFDAIKETMLTNIIRTGLKDRIDYLTLFRKIHYALQMKEFPSILLTQSKAGATKYNRRKPKEIIDDFKQRFRPIYDNYRLQFSRKTVSDIDDTRNFLFHDHRYHTVLQNGKKFIKMEFDKEKQIYNISFVEDKPEDEFQNIQIMLSRIEREIKWFEKGVFLLALNYMELKNEESGRHVFDEFTLESAVSSVLNLFGLEDEYMDYLLNHIMSDEKVHKETAFNNEALRDKTFYQTGFRYFDFVNDVDDDMQSKIHMTSMTSTPEKLLLQITDKAKVIGISATATLNTVLGNFDLNYIRHNLNSRFYEIPKYDRKRMEYNFASRQAGYENIAIRSKVISYAPEDGWSKLFGNKPELAEKALSLVMESLGDNSSKDYYSCRYMRITSAYKQFQLHEMRSFLCVMTMHPTNVHSTLQKDVLFKLFSFVHEEIGWCGDFDENNICYLNGTEYDENKELISQRLSNGEKLFVISVYKTLGAGQNLQYCIPEEVRKELVCTSYGYISKDKDYDGIYLDRPTFLMVNSNKFTSEESFIKYIYQIEYLNENGEISSADAFKYIKAAFARYLMPKEDKSISRTVRDAKKLSETMSYENLGARILIQAVGRICRTNMKRNEIFLLSDDYNINFLHFLGMRDRQYNQEFISLYKTLTGYDFKQGETYAYWEEKASKRSEIAARQIHDFLYEREWTKERISVWESLRDYTLKHPTLSDQELMDSPWQYGYCSLPRRADRYWYGIKKEEYHEVPVRFRKISDETLLEVSAENCLLEFLMKQKFLFDKFREKGYATSFKSNDAIMTPTLYNNIYKGALGEVVGCMILESLSCKLQRVPEDTQKFEYFDYILENADVYIDFKNWKPSMMKDESEELRKIYNKAIVVGTEAIMIINLYDPSERDGDVKYIDGVRILQIPSLLVKDESGIPHTNIKAWNLMKKFIQRYGKV